MKHENGQNADVQKNEATKPLRMPTYLQAI